MADDRPAKGLFITSDPDVTTIEGARGVPEPARLPLRLFVAGDYAPHAGADGAAARPHRVDRHTFADLMRTLAPRLRLDVPNRVGAGPSVLEVELDVPDLAAFAPEAVARQVPVLAPLVRLRALTAELLGGTLDLAAFRARLADADVDLDVLHRLDAALTPPARPAPTGGDGGAAGSADGDALDRLLALVDPGASDAARPVGDGGTADELADALLGAVAGPSDASARFDRAAAERMAADLDRLVAAQLDAIFTHPAFRALESAWRGLKFLVDRLDFRRGIELFVLPAPKAGLSEALYHGVLVPAHADAPAPTMVLLDHTFDHGAADVALLDDLAETGASLQVPVVGNAGADFFGVETAEGLTALPPLWQHFERPEYIAFNKLRDRKEARYLALALPEFVLRPAHAGAVGGVRLDEPEALLGRAALAVGAAVGASFAETGWPTHIGGAEHRLADLPLRTSAAGRAPLAVLLPDTKLSDFAKAGFVVLGGALNRDYAYVARANTVGRPEAYEDLMAATEARVHATLTCTLFVARAVQAVLALQERLVAADAASAVAGAQDELNAFLRIDGRPLPPDAVTVEPVPERETDEGLLLAVRLRTPDYVLPRPVSLVLGLPVRKATPA